MPVWPLAADCFSRSKNSAEDLTTSLKNIISEALNEVLGPVDACCKAIDRVVGIPVKLKDYTLHSVTAGQEALGEVSVVVEKSGKDYAGRGASTDIVEASAKAYLRALNRIVQDLERRKTKRKTPRRKGR